MIRATPKEFGKALCNALGVDIKGVTEIVIRCAVGEGPTIQVTRYVEENADVASLDRWHVDSKPVLSQRTETFEINVKGGTDEQGS